MMGCTEHENTWEEVRDANGEDNIWNCEEFISKSPQTISTLVDIVEKSIAMASFCKYKEFLYGTKMDKDQKELNSLGSGYLDYVKEKLDD